MTNEIIKIKLQVITDASDKIVILEICFEKKAKESVVRTFKYMCTAAVHCWYIKEAVADIVQRCKRFM